MLTLRVTESELTRLRRIDHAARRFIEAFDKMARVAEKKALKGHYDALSKALYEAPTGAGSPHSAPGEGT